MSLDFRCENCGNMLSATDGRSGSVKCPHCGKKTDIPAGLASMPRPIVPPDDAAAQGGVVPPQPRPPVPVVPPPIPVRPAPAHAQHHAQTDEVAGVLAIVMPWVISLFFHLGIGLIVYFIAYFGSLAVAKPVPDDVIIPEVEYVENPGTLTQGGGSSSGNKTVNVRSLTKDEYTRNEAPVDTGVTKTRVPISVAGGAGASVGGAEGGGLKLGSGNGAGNGPRVGLLGNPGGNAHHVVYVIDRSGSMKDSFDFVHTEMRDSFRKLQGIQDFHIIFFASGPPTENPPQKLVPATEEYKIEATEFLNGIATINQTDPLPALKRAFEVLRNADPNKKGKILFLLTDGEFPDNARVLKLIAEENANKDVHICTILYGHRSPTAEKVMEQIASENGGKFTHVDPNEDNK